MDHRRIEDENGNSMWKTIIRYFVVAVCSGSLSFGVSQTLIVTSLKERVIINTGRLDTLGRDLLEEKTARAVSDIETEKKALIIRDDCNERIRNITALLQDLAKSNARLIEQNTELITLIKLQNNLVK